MTLAHNLVRQRQERVTFWKLSGSLFLFAADTVALTLAGWISIILKFPDHVANPRIEILNWDPTYDTVLVIISIAWLLRFVMGGSYSPYLQLHTSNKDKILLNKSIIFLFSLGFSFYVFKISFSRTIFVFYAILSINLIFFFRFLLNTLVFRRLREHRQFTRGLLIIGTDLESTEKYREWIDSNPDYGYHVADVCILESSATELAPHLNAVFQGDKPTDALILSLAAGDISVANVVDYLSSYPIKTHVIPMLVEQGGFFNFLVREDDSPFFSVVDSRLSQVDAFIKRAFDIVFSAVILFLLAPIFLAISILIKMADGGPIFYMSERVGQDGELFRFIKFRSMIINAENLKELVANKHDGDHLLFKAENDPRVTDIGKILRRFSLDELPQFINVLKGEMSVVGPRPPLPDEVMRYSQLALRRMRVKPGITGPWQVNGRADLTWNKSLLLDLNYSIKWSFTGDLWIVLRTIGVMITGKGAY